MEQAEMERLIRNIDERLARVEQKLPTLATKDDLKTFPTKDELKTFATKDDLKAFATKKDLNAFATKDDLRAFATKEELKAFATKVELQAAIAPLATREEMHTAIREEGERTRRHFDVVAEAMGFQLSVVAEAHGTLDQRVADIARRHSDMEHWRDRFDMRVQALETAASRRRK